MEEFTQYPNINNFNPSECLSGKMMRCNRIIANIFRKHLTQFNITDSQLSILFIISKVKNSNQKKIAEVLYLEKSTVNRNINRLLKHNIITYSNGKELVLTEHGKKLLNNVLPHWQKAMTEIKTVLDTKGEQALNLLTAQLSA